MGHWYSYKRMLSYNCFLNMVMSPRGNGKSYGAKKIIIENYLKKKKQSVYVRRTQKEVDKIKSKYWNDIRGAYPNLEFDIKGDVGFINGDAVVFFVALSTSSDLKSDAFPDVNFLFFDEYVITQTTHKRYLKNEMTLLFDLFETIFRKRIDAKVILMSNAVSFVNPLFDYYNIIPIKDRRFQRFHGKQVLLELFTDEGFIKEKLDTPFGRLIQGTEYGNYAISNEVLEDSNDFLRNRKGEGYWNYMCAMKSHGYEVAFWYDVITKDVFVDMNIDNNRNEKYCVQIEDSEEGYTQLREVKKDPTIRKIRNAFNNGQMYYKTQSIKKFVEGDIIRYI